MLASRPSARCCRRLNNCVSDCSRVSVAKTTSRRVSASRLLRDDLYTAVVSAAVVPMIRAYEREHELDRQWNSPEHYPRSLLRRGCPDWDRGRPSILGKEGRHWLIILPIHQTPVKSSATARLGYRQRKSFSASVKQTTSHAVSVPARARAAGCRALEHMSPQRIVHRCERQRPDERLHGIGKPLRREEHARENPHRHLNEIVRPDTASIVRGRAAISSPIALNASEARIQMTARSMSRPRTGTPKAMTPKAIGTPASRPRTIIRQNRKESRSCVRDIGVATSRFMSAGGANRRSRTRAPRVRCS